MLIWQYWCAEMESSLTQGRELKLSILCTVIWVVSSPLTQGRELKYDLLRFLQISILWSPLTQGLSRAPLRRGRAVRVLSFFAAKTKKAPPVYGGTFVLVEDEGLEPTTSAM